MLGAWNDWHDRRKLVARQAEAEEVTPLTSCSRPMKEMMSLRRQGMEACYRDLIQSKRNQEKITRITFTQYL